MSSLLPAVTGVIARPLKDPLPLLDTNSQVSIFHPKAPSGFPILMFHAFPSAPGSDSFSSWTPPVSIPARWKGGEAAYAPPLPNISDVSAAVKADDKICIMTGARTAFQSSHLVPKAEGAWFASHYAVLRGYGGSPTDDLDSGSSFLRPSEMIL
ncbi:hypothetical protein BDZ89DRAFT_479261 [Hymenopellis radicata]|nr:hypothetical protein BDZ89DRAFT_479261 [Hymenopellis radicata]